MRVWQPIGFKNVFEIPDGLPVTAETMARVPVTLYEVSFHRQRTMAILHRNGVTRADLEGGYLELAAEFTLTDEHRQFYRFLGVTGI